MPYSHRRGGDRREGTQGRHRVVVERENPREHRWSVRNRFGDLAPSYMPEPTLSSCPSLARPTLVVFVGPFANESSSAPLPWVSAPTNDTTPQATKQSPSRMFTSARPTPRWIANHRASFAPPLNNLQRGWLERLGVGDGLYLGHHVVRLIFASIPGFLVASAMHGSARETVEKAVKQLESSIRVRQELS